MRVLVVVCLLIALPTTAAAQAPQQGARDLAPDGILASTSFDASIERGGAPLVVTGMNALEEATPLSGVRMDAQAPAPLPPLGRRRRGSMVGYIDDATVESKIRIRFDSALQNTVPDRAEFFYAKCGCYQDLLGNPAFDPDAPGPRPGAVNDSNYQQLYVWGEYAFGNAVSLFGQLPVRWFQPQSFIPGTGAGFPDQSGLGDIRAGARLAVTASDTHSLTVQGQFFFPTGDASKALGTDHASFEPEILYYQELSEAFTLESQVGVWLPFEGSAGVPISADDGFAGRVMNYGIGGAYNLLPQSKVQLAPVVELVGWHVFSGFQTAATPDASGTNIVNLKLGGRVSFDTGHSLYVGYGHALTDETWYDDIVRFEYRFSF